MIKSQEVRTEKEGLLIGVLKQDEKGQICLETKKGKRTDSISLEALVKIIQYIDANTNEFNMKSA